MAGFLNWMINRKLSASFEAWQANVSGRKHSEALLKKSQMRMIRYWRLSETVPEMDLKQTGSQGQYEGRALPACSSLASLPSHPPVFFSRALRGDRVMCLGEVDRGLRRISAELSTSLKFMPRDLFQLDCGTWKCSLACSVVLQARIRLVMRACKALYRILVSSA